MEPAAWAGARTGSQTGERSGELGDAPTRRADRRESLRMTQCSASLASDILIRI